MDKAKPAFALTDANHNLLLLLAVIDAFALLLSADVCLIKFNDSAQLRYIAFAHDFADAMIQIPCCLISADPQVPLQLLCADSFFRVQHERDCMEPHYEREMRIVKDRAGCGSKLVMAG